MVSRTPSWFHVERSRRPLTGSPCWMPAGGVECDARRSTWNRWIRAWQMPSVSAFGRRRGDRPPKVPRETKFGSMPATAPSGRRQIHGAARGAGGCFTWNNWWWGGALTCPWRDCSDDDAARVTLTGDGAEAGCAPDRPCRISTVTSGATFHVEQSRPSSGARNRSGVVADQYQASVNAAHVDRRVPRGTQAVHAEPGQDGLEVRRR